jgi:hypothetical protein
VLNLELVNIAVDVFITIQHGTLKVQTRIVLTLFVLMPRIFLKLFFFWLDPKETKNQGCLNFPCFLRCSPLSACKAARLS